MFDFSPVPSINGYAHLAIIGQQATKPGALAPTPTPTFTALVCRVGDTPLLEKFDRQGKKLNRIIGGLLDWDYVCSGYDVEFSVPDIAFCYYDGSDRRRKNVLGFKGNIIIARDMYHTTPSNVYDGYLMGDLTPDQLQGVLDAIARKEIVWEE